MARWVGLGEFLSQVRWSLEAKARVTISRLINPIPPSINPPNVKYSQYIIQKHRRPDLGGRLFGGVAAFDLECSSGGASFLQAWNNTKLGGYGCFLSFSRTATNIHSARLS